MCELFGISGQTEMTVNEYLKVFASHSEKHPNGWGMAIFHSDTVSVEKEPQTASKSRYLTERLRSPLKVQNMIAHIRLATRGQMEYCNCHPFVRKDASGRSWTLAHNGTIFDCPQLSSYLQYQDGQTDSERILLYIIDQINREIALAQKPLDAQERFAVIDKVIHTISPHNKVNLLLYDGELMYVHKNYRNSLYKMEVGTSCVFATVPLSPSPWEQIPLNQLEAYKSGKRFFSGSVHKYEYIDNPEDMHLLFLDYSGL